MAEFLTSVPPFELVFNYTCDLAFRLFLGLFVVDPYSAWFHFSLFVGSLVYYRDTEDVAKQDANRRSATVVKQCKKLAPQIATQVIFFC